MRHMPPRRFYVIGFLVDSYTRRNYALVDVNLSVRIQFPKDTAVVKIVTICIKKI